MVKVGKALRDADGASFEYQQIELELHGLKRTLEGLQALQPNSHNAAHINAIRCLALSCRLPLLAFMEKLEKYGVKFGARAKRSFISSAGRKTQWALLMGEDVQKFRAIIAAKVLSLNLLLSVQNALVASLSTPDSSYISQGLIGASRSTYQPSASRAHHETRSAVHGSEQGSSVHLR